MAQDWARDFYNSKAWQDTSRAYKKMRGGICEDCEAKGLYNAGRIVHHKRQLTPQNITDTDIALNFENLRLLCYECHAEAHGFNKKRYVVDENGNVTPKKNIE